MTAPFDFKAWQALTGWSAPQVAQRTGLSVSLCQKLSNGTLDPSPRAETLCRQATADLLAQLAPFAAAEPPGQRIRIPGGTMRAAPAQLRALLAAGALTIDDDGTLRVLDGVSLSDAVSLIATHRAAARGDDV